MAFAVPEKLTASQIKKLSDKERTKVQAQVEKACAKGHLIDDYDPANFSEDDRRIFQIPVFHYEPDVSGLGVRRHSSGVAIRGERGQFAKVLKEAKAVVKGLNAGETFPAVVSVPTGRPKGRPKLAAA
jgi:Zn-dependent membrane protease YugP